MTEQLPPAYLMTLAQVNNLVRFLYTNGWISPEEHSAVIFLLRELITWLEQHGVKVDLNMPEIEE